MKNPGSGKTRKLFQLQDELFSLWWSGKNDRYIAAVFGVTASAICQWRIRNGLPKNDERGRKAKCATEE